MRNFSRMSTPTYHLIGVMSGTSLDGIDLAYLSLNLEANQWHYHFITTDTTTYSQSWENRLAEANQLTSPEAIKLLDREYTAHLAEVITQFIRANSIQNIDAICSHGHTVFHQPQRAYTLQIGNLPQLATLLQQKVVCDFRIQDVKLGGQGAPLVPIGDQLLFPQYEACINLGGFANISLTENKRRIAFDICAVNTVLNTYAQRCGRPFDDQGQIAKSATISTSLLAKLNTLDFYQQKGPKSLGIEWVNKVIFPLLENSMASPKTILATYTHHVADQLANAVSRFEYKKILFTGGGAYNNYLIELLRVSTTNTLIIPDKNLIDYKEALIFALLGVLKLRGAPNVLKTVTGAKTDHSAGFIYSPTTI